jgi:dTDP-glucose 4,6-dehydratase
MKKILITGTAGFIFSNFIRKCFNDQWQYHFTSIDKIIAPYNRKNVYRHKDHSFYMGDIADEIFVSNVFAMEKPDIVIHGAAESFVDDAIRGALPFVHSNITGTQVMLDMSLKYGVERFVYISTDEVYGQLKPGDPSWTEECLPRPRNPYSASKYAGEVLVYAANQTHGLNYNITRCSNNFGRAQPPRNLVPRAITSMLNNVSIPIHGEGKQIREWTYVEDNCSAIMTIVDKAPLNEIYNIGSGVEFCNLDMVMNIAKVLKIDEPKIHYITDRKGHDYRYSVDCSKIKQLGWAPKYDFDSGLHRCVYWYMDNQKFYDT